MEQELQSRVLQEAGKEVVKKRYKNHCSSTKVYKRGKQKGVQAYRCNACWKWYSETTGTPLYDIRLKSKWQAYLKAYGVGNAHKEDSHGTQYQYPYKF